MVTGAARRLGRAIALALADHGCRTIIHFNSSGEEAEQLVLQIQRSGGTAWCVRADLTDPDELDDLFAQSTEAAGMVDIVVNNASVFESDVITEASPEDLDLNVRLHVSAAMHLSQRMHRQGGQGHIINMLDSRVTDYDRCHATYHLSKRMLLTLTKMLALELAPEIAVNAVAPGLILPPEGEDASYLESLAHTNPLHTHGDPGDVTEAVLFLAKSRFITGQVIYIDGGRNMRGAVYG